ncbi:CaiB/BaiF CoA transferase family protein [Nonomuraea cavernae]|uniref:Succinyl-CoA--D-citramalate CoA-transferase n=1 Tax=Nonomuraea cavernae TaxID=2045107 RepID=A0A918DRV7_9ACTN|nr:CoA transferase [Nonomuraea cavernae]MCA2189760.1 CoA transferase [Nonomuraea cavernae]GGO79935.1 succinyl-CoA--D-citramalate CoA-transferase [Nonomuraea cavernae]
MNEQMKAGPLDGIRVLELGTMYAAPTAGRMLRDFGAQVIKVEDPSTGDFARHWTPQKDGLSLGFTRLNAGKRSVGIDLRTDEGRGLVRRLAASVDVVIESFRPGRLEAWGLGYEALSQDNPGLILTRVSGFGQTGPYRERPGFGTVAETASGFAFINGWPETPPTSPPFGFADSIAGISAAMGTAMALFKRERVGTGEVVDVALYEPLLFILGDLVLKFQATGEIQRREGNGTGAASPRGIYQASDGRWLSIAASNQGIARRLFDAMGRPELIEDPRFATNADRMANNEAVQAEVTAWVASRPRDEILAVLDTFEVVSAPVNDASDVLADPHFRERTLVELTGNSILGSVLMPGPVLHLAGYEGPAYEGVPAIGEHTREVLADVLKLTETELDALAERRVTAPASA